MPDSPQQRHQRVLLPRYGAHFSTVHSHVVLQLRRCINSIFGTGIISQCCDGGVDPAVHPELRDLRGYAENTLLASLYGHHLICILSAMLHVGRSQAGRALPCVRPWLLCVPRTPPWPHLAKYNAARWPFTARARETLFDSKTKQAPQMWGLFRFGIRQCPTLPGRHQPSTIGAERLNFCVRYGNRWIPFAITTGMP